MEIKNVAYGSDAAQKMDVYLPKDCNEIDTKVIVMIHGGGWVAGDKRDFDQSIVLLRQQLPGYAVFNLNYRLASFTGGNLWPTQMNDINAAFAFIAGKQNDYKVNTNKMAVIGASAGAQLALLQAYKKNAGEQIKAVIDMFGPTDLTNMYHAISKVHSYSLLGVFMGGTPTSNVANYLSASPLLLVDSKVPPTLIFHGTDDHLVPISQSDSLDKRLEKAGVKHQYIKYAGERHGWSGINLIDTYQKIIAFIKENVN